jgi:uncharacterized heparinase superfamily protein
MLTKVLLLFNTVKYLKFIQIVNRVKRRIITPKLKPPVNYTVATNINHFKVVIKCQQKILGINSFKFLNKEASINTIEDWNSVDLEKLWLYNLHYFDDLNANNSEERVEWHKSLIQKWIDENPIGYGNGWEPYPSSLRIVNWIKWSFENNSLKNVWLDSLVSQVSFLNKNLEYHILGNHLFTNAKALIFAGLYFNGSDAKSWYRRGIKILNEELPEQVLSDGGNFELSPMYHAIFLEDLLDIINIHQAYEKKLPDSMVSKVTQMLDWMKTMCHPDGGISFFNDSVFNIAPTLCDLLDYSERLKIANTNSQESQLIHLKESGYIRVNKDELTLIADIADIGPDYIPGHGHADALSFELSLFGERLVVNSGISTYEVGNDRNMQRGTKAHSTITIDDTDSSEVWSGFRVARRAKVFNIKSSKGVGGIEFSACHDGYKRLDGKIEHCRKWSVSDGFLEIADHITGSGNHLATSVLPLHPKVLVGKVQEDSVDLEIRGKKVKVSFKGKGTLLVKESYYYPEFGLSVSNRQLIYNYNGNLPLKTSIKISW